jgi:alkylhydroperoxidase family enzyme
MSLITTVPVDAATGKVQEVYAPMLEATSMVPRPLQMLSASPDLLEIYNRNLWYYLRHPTLSFALLAHIRVLASIECGFPYCIELNSGFLKQRLGLTEEQLRTLRSDPAQAPLEEKDRAMLLFVLEALRAPEDVSREDVAALHDLGWTDRDILDATQHGAGMVATGILFNAFKMHED